VGLQVPQLGEATQRALAKVMPAFGAAGNPVDVTGQFVSEPGLLRESVVALLADPQVHVGIVWLQLMTAHVDLLVDIFRNIRDRTTKPFVVCWVAAPEEALRRLRAEGLTVFGAGERAVEAVAALVRYHAGRRIAAQRGAPPALPPVDTRADDGVQPTVEATRRLQAVGVPMAPLALARDAAEAVAHWRRLGGPVVLKIESPDITHKTEIGGVLLKLDDEAAVRAGFDTLVQRARAARPDARIAGVVVQAMARGEVELVVGVKRDETFGMMVMVGLGGVFVEVMKDVVFRRAPFSADEGLRMLGELRMGALLDGARGRPPVDRPAVAALLSNLSAWAAAMSPVLEELDLNPMLVGPEGPVGVDCVMVFKARA
jgi:acetyltransferase